VTPWLLDASPHGWFLSPDEDKGPGVLPRLALR
jgi:hypothetical protein